MKLGETDPLRRRIGPLRCVDASGTPVTSGFGTAGAVEVQTDNGAFVAAGGSITVIGNGWVYYLATLAEASTGESLAVKLEGICVEFTWRENLETAPQGIPVGTTNPALLESGAMRIADADGNELSTVVGITAEVSRNGAAWAAAGGVLALIEPGYAKLSLVAGDAAQAGWTAVRLSGACQEFVIRLDIVEPVSGGGPLTAPTLTVTSVFSEQFRIARLQQWSGLIGSMTSGAALVVLVRYIERNEMIVARDLEGNWRWPFDVTSEDTNEISGTDPLTLKLLPRGGWPPCTIEVQCGAGLIAEET